MRLSYRGTSYDYDPIRVDQVESPIKRHYRGQPFNVSYPRHIPVPQPIQNLTYRGVAYRTTGTGGVEAVVPVAETAAAIPTINWSTRQARQALMKEVGRIHRTNIERSLLHRLEVARAKGDQYLVGQLEREMQQIA